MFIEFNSYGQIKSMGECAENIYVAVCDEKGHSVGIGDLPYLTPVDGNIYKRANVYVSRWGNGVIDSVGGVRIYHWADDAHTVERIGNTFIYRWSNDAHTIERIGNTHIYRWADDYHTVERIGDVSLYRWGNGLVERVGNLHVERWGNGHFESIGGISAERLANCFLKV